MDGIGSCRWFRLIGAYRVFDVGQRVESTLLATCRYFVAEFDSHLQANKLSDLVSVKQGIERG